MKGAASRVESLIKIEADKVIRTMRGGIGASWHALSKDIPLENDKYDYPVRYNNPRGSAYGGNPPTADHDIWDQIYKHASWLGLNFIRVEISQRMYEPERGVFDWDNEEMKSLYNILDWCERSHADVFLQQMWGHVEWNAYPGVHPLLSAPRSIDDFGTGIATLLEHLLKTKNYSCIRYFSITNEPPGGTWGYWWSFGSGSGTITPALKSVREHLDAAGIDLALSGPDWTSLPPLDPSRIDFDEFVGAYDIHSYGGIDDAGRLIIRDWVDWAHGRNKPFFLTEFGNMNLGWGGTDSGPRSFNAALSNASDIIHCLNLGVDGLNRWSFVNRGDLDGQWQLIRTWDPDKKTYQKKVLPEWEAYLGFGIVSRFIGKYSRIVRSSIPPHLHGVHAAALVSRTGELTAILLNSGEADHNVQIEINGHRHDGRLYLYQVTREIPGGPDPNLEPSEMSADNSGQIAALLPAKSISVLTNYRLTSEDNGIFE
jgi:Cellulase (glycosyl hydrolase family 5)